MTSNPTNGIEPPANERGVALWESESWRDRAVTWLDDQIETAGIERTGPVQQTRVRPWSTLLTAPTTAGATWFKAAAAATEFEVALYPLLHRIAPADVLAPIATDVAQGWIVLPNGGAHLSDILENIDLVEAMMLVLPRYGVFQRSLMPHVDDMLALGVPDMRPDVLPERFDEVLATVRRYVDRHGTGADRGTLERVEALRETFAFWCGRVASSPVPPSLDHNDLHPNNVLIGNADSVDRARFYDWGDSVIAHPFASMLVPLRFLQDHLDAVNDDARIHRVRDAYLDVFSDYGSHDDLVETLELACQAGKVARALSWQRALGMQRNESDRFADAPFQWLSSLLYESFLD